MQEKQKENKIKVKEKLEKIEFMLSNHNILDNMKIVEHEETKIFIGQNAKENWELLENNENYWWFHLKSFPSCHVVILEEDPGSMDILEAAKLCRDNTKYRNLKNIKVNYTQIKNIKKSKEVGSVEFKSNRQVSTITI